MEPALHSAELGPVEALVTEHMDYARALAGQIARGLPGHIDREELEGFAYLGLTQRSLVLPLPRLLAHGLSLGLQQRRAGNQVLQPGNGRDKRPGGGGDMGPQPLEPAGDGGSGRGVGHA